MSGLEVANGGGLGALWAWLRGSSDSISSAGSARTTGSFVFQIGAPSTSPPPSPAFSYRRRSRDSLTLHRKYGLLRDPIDVTQNRFSVADPTVVRERRAVSESLQRRSVHVPGKRRAPPPPGLASATLPRSVHRRYGRKRPAPQPPPRNDGETLIKTAPQNNSHYRNSMPQITENLPDLCKTDKRTVDITQIKYRPQKNFLKKIFESRKRNSTIQTEPVKILPSIRDLDIQAMEIIEARRKMKQISSQDSEKIRNNSNHACVSYDNGWFCTNCLRKYTLSTLVCHFCQPDKHKDQKSKNTKMKPIGVEDDKEKLRKILKEMKDSLPKNTQRDCNGKIKGSSTIVNHQETPTLRIGTSQDFQNLKVIKSKLNTGNATTSHLSSINNVVTTQTVVLVDSPNKIVDEKVLETKTESTREFAGETSASDKMIVLQTPLNISTLLNPVYVPKKYHVNKPLLLSAADQKNERNKITIPTTSFNSAQQSFQDVSKLIKRNKIDNNETSKKPNNETILTALNLSDKNKINAPSDINKHYRRRELINQLEKSIAEGNERSAAEAAVKLAQLRLSCSVLSFASQIVNNKSTIEENKEHTIANSKVQNQLTKYTDMGNGITPINNVNEFNSGKPVDGPSTSSDPNLYKITPIPDPTKLLSETKSVEFKTKEEDMISILVWVEDKVTTRGPMKLFIQRQASLRELKARAEAAFGLAATLQRWIVGQTLCTHDDTPLVSLAGFNFTAPFYLCLVHPEKSVVSPLSPKGRNKEYIDKNGPSEVYSELVRLEKRPIVTNTEAFECGVCLEKCKVGEGTILRECVHTFCKICLADFIRQCEDALVPCPATACDGVLQEREIRALVTADEYEKWLARGLAAAESSTKDAFHCRTRDCSGWALCDPGVRRFPCPVCKLDNCVPCQAIHEKETCEGYQLKLRQAAENPNFDPALTDDSTKALIDSLFAKGEALECPECKAVITKKWGCDWLKCSACKTEICWVTKGRRWGPAGRGDTSAGCKCGVDGKRCHPTCGYCH